MKILNAMDLANGERSDYNRSGTLTQPLQFLAKEFKTDEWGCHNADWLEWQAIRQIGRNARKIMKNYKLAKGVIDRSDYIVDQNPEYSDLLDTLMSDTESALELKFYPIIPNVINTMCTEFSKRNTSVAFLSVDDASHNDMLELKYKQVETVLVQNAQQMLVQKLIEQGLDPKSPEFQQQTSPEAVKSLPEIQQYFNKSYRSMMEQWAAHQHEIDVERFAMDELEERAFRDMLTTDKVFFHFNMGEDDYDIETWNPALVAYHKSPGQRYMSGANWITKIDMMSIADVIDKYGWLMTQEQLESLEAIYPVRAAGYALQGYQNDGTFYDATKSHDWNTNRPSLEWRQFMSMWDGQQPGGDIVHWILNQSENAFNIDFTYLLRVTTGYWKSQRKVGYLTSVKQNGEIIVDIVDETYKVFDKPIYDTRFNKNRTAENLVYGDHIDWIWINQTWGFVKLGPNRPTFLGMSNPGGVNLMYLGINQNKIGPLKFQFKGEKTVYGCKIPVEGAAFSDRNTKSMSLVDLMKPFQISYNIVNNQIADILVDELGTVILLDQNALPKHSMGQDWSKNPFAHAYVAMKDFQILPLDNSISNTDGPLSFSHFQSLNLEQTQRLLSRVQLANYFKQQAYEIIGITPQRMGQQVGQTNTATGVEQAVSASYAQTEMYFTQFTDYLMPRVHQMRNDLAMYYQAKNPSNRLKYMTSSEERINFQINGVDFLTRDVNIYCTTKIQHRTLIENLKKLAVENNTTGASIYDLGNIMKSNSMAEIDHALKSSEQKVIAQKQEEQQSAEKLKQMEIDAREREIAMERDWKTQLEEAKNRKDIMVAEIRAAGYGAMQDLNANAQSDYLDFLDTMKQDQNFQETMNLQREKEVNRKMENREKQLTEEKKLQTQIELKKMDMAIARENKNSFDLKAKHKENERRNNQRKKK